MRHHYFGDPACVFVFVQAKRLYAIDFSNDLISLPRTTEQRKWLAKIAKDSNIFIESNSYTLVDAVGDLFM